MNFLLWIRVTAISLPGVNVPNTYKTMKLSSVSSVDDAPLPATFTPEVTTIGFEDVPSPATFRPEETTLGVYTSVSPSCQCNSIPTMVEIPIITVSTITVYHTIFQTPSKVKSTPMETVEYPTPVYTMKPKSVNTSKVITKEPTPTVEYPIPTIPVYTMKKSVKVITEEPTLTVEYPMETTPVYTMKPTPKPVYTRKVNTKEPTPTVEYPIPMPVITMKKSFNTKKVNTMKPTPTTRVYTTEPKAMHTPPNQKHVLPTIMEPLVFTESTIVSFAPASTGTVESNDGTTDDAVLYADQGNLDIQSDTNVVVDDGNTNRVSLYDHESVVQGYDLSDASV